VDGHQTIEIGIYRNARGEAHVVEFSSERGAVTFLLIGAPASL